MATNSEEMPSIRCSGCGKKLKYPSKLAGKQIGCPKCGTTLMLPAIESAVSADFNSASPTIDSLEPIPIGDELDSFAISESASNTIADVGAHSSGVAASASGASQTQSSEVEDDDEFRLAPVETSIRKPALSPIVSANPLDDFDLGDFDSLVPPVSAPSGVDTSKASAGSASGGGTKQDPSVKPKDASPKTATSKNQPPVRTDFRYPCKVCGTAMHANIKEVGNKVRCPDCYSEFSIPSPPPGWNKPKNIGPTSLDDAAAMPLAAVEQRTARTSGPTISNAEVMMERAAASLAEDSEKDRREIYDFESSGWTIRNFGFMKDPTALVIALVTGLFLGGALVAALICGNMAANATSDPERKDTMRAIAANLALVILAAPIFFGTLANGVAILEAAANQLQRIARWPAFNIGEAMDEVMVVVASFGLASLPGALLQWFGPTVGIPEILSTIIMLLITWFAFPVLLLSMLDNQAITEPISRDVIKSMQSRHNAWGAMYMMTAMAFVFAFGFYLLQTNDRTGLRFAMGFVIPILVFSVFQQYGLLAARISSVTELGFESIEDDDDDSSEDEEV